MDRFLLIFRKLNIPASPRVMLAFPPCGVIKTGIGQAMTLSYAQIEHLFHQYRDEVTRRLLTMVQSRETAADLVQETYLRLLGLADRQVVEQPRALLHRIATNLAIDHARREKNRLHDSGDAEATLNVASPVPSQERQLQAKQRFHRILQSTEVLPPRTREAFLLYRVYGYTYREIACRMGISESAVEKLLMRALDQFCRSVETQDSSD